jgi:hypothetical protein
MPYPCHTLVPNGEQGYGPKTGDLAYGEAAVHSRPGYRAGCSLYCRLQDVRAGVPGVSSLFCPLWMLLLTPLSRRDV